MMSSDRSSWRMVLLSGMFQPTRLLWISLAALSLSVQSAGAQELPAHVRSDVLQREIVDALSRNDASTVLGKIDQLRQEAHEVPAPILYVEAVLTERTDPVRSSAALEKYFNTTSSADKNYQAALGLYSRVKPAANRALEQKAELERKAQARIAHEREQVEAKRIESLQPKIDQMITDLRDQMVVIPTGTFKMGDVARVARGTGPNRKVVTNREQPIQIITIKTFLISKYELTRAPHLLYLEHVNASTYGARTCDDPRCPVQLSWPEANAFLNWLRVQSKLPFRLPSESEWEYAARGGTQAAYWWGSKFDRSKENFEFDAIMTGQRSVNPFGLFDVGGNLQEWTQDCWARIDPFEPQLDGIPLDGSPRSTGCFDQWRVLKGPRAKFYNSVLGDPKPYEFRISYREQGDVTQPCNGCSGRYGLRLVLDSNP